MPKYPHIAGIQTLAPILKMAMIKILVSDIYVLIVVNSLSQIQQKIHMLHIETL